MTVSSSIATQGHRNSSRKPSDLDEHAFGAFPSSSRFEAEQENSITGLKKWDMGLRRMTSLRRNVEYQNSEGNTMSMSTSSTAMRNTAPASPNTEAHADVKIPNSHGEPNGDESSNLSAIGPKPVRQEHSPFKAGGGILAQTPVSKEVFDILKQREKVKQLHQAKFETNPVTRRTGAIENNAQLKDLTGGVQVNHIDPQLFDNPYNIPWVDFYCGGGGMGHGSVKKQGKFNLICVLAVGINETACLTHRLSHP